MIISLFDVHPIQLHPTFDASEALADIRHSQTLFSANRDKLLDELREQGAAEVELHDDAAHELHVWEKLESGYLKWSRDSSSAPARSLSGLRSEMEAELTIVAFAPGTTVPQEGPPPPGTSNKKIVVKIRKQGGLPLP